MSNLYAVSGLIACRYHTANPLVLIAQRASHKPFGSLWEFPGGKLEAGETPEEAIKRELAEELSGLDVVVGERIATVTVSVEKVSREIALYRCLIKQEAETPICFIRPSPDSLQRIKWISPRDLDQWDLIPGAARFSPHVIRYFSARGAR